MHPPPKTILALAAAREKTPISNAVNATPTNRIDQSIEELLHRLPSERANSVVFPATYSMACLLVGFYPHTEGCTAKVVLPDAHTPLLLPQLPRLTLLSVRAGLEAAEVERSSLEAFGFCWLSLALNP